MIQLISYTSELSDLTFWTLKQNQKTSLRFISLEILLNEISRAVNTNDRLYPYSMFLLEFDGRSLNIDYIAEYKDIQDFLSDYPEYLI